MNTLTLSPESHRMRTLIVALGLLALPLAVAAPAQAQVHIQVVLPRVLPPLVIVEPGVQVIEDMDDEVFFSGGYYWVRRDDRWYRTRDHTAQWRYVEVRRVPGGIVRYEPGHYRRWKRAEHQERHEGPPGKSKHGRGHRKDK